MNTGNSYGCINFRINGVKPFLLIIILMISGSNNATHTPANPVRIYQRMAAVAGETGITCDHRCRCFLTGSSGLLSGCFYTHFLLSVVKYIAWK